jgi:tRNA threonylcarbamoyladenosine biosynthesis protein TsaE
MMTQPEDVTLTLHSNSVAQTQAMGERIGQMAAPGALILLSGELGSGKTALTQGIARGLNIATTVNSPTFTLLKEHHDGWLPLYHFDLYRLGNPEEMWSLGFDDYFAGDGVCVVEWANRAADAWFGEWLWLHLTATSDAEREIRCMARGQWARETAQALAGGRGPTP